jgi:hypothetical protein
MRILPRQTDDEPLLPLHDGPIAPEPAAAMGALSEIRLLSGHIVLPNP